MPPFIPDEFLEQMASIFRVLGDSTRLAILRALMAGEKRVGQVVEETGQGQANVSKHLRVLAESGLVARRKEGLQAYYRISNPMVEQLCRLVCETMVKDMHADVERKGKLLHQWAVKRKKP